MVAFVDTNSDPEGIDFVIPTNDDDFNFMFCHDLLSTLFGVQKWRFLRMENRLVSLRKR